MSLKAQTRAELALAVEDLSARLSEAEDTLQAIRNGEVDALIVAGSQGDQVLTLSGAEAPYRLFIEEMNEGAVTLSEQGLILYCNHRFAAVLQAPFNQVIGAVFSDFLAEADRLRFQQLLLAGQHGSSRGEMSLQAADLTLVPVNLSLNFLAAGTIGVVCVVVTDLTELKEREGALRQAYDELEQRVVQRTATLSKTVQKLEASNQQTEQAHREWVAAMDAMHAAIFMHDKDYRIIRCNRAYTECAGLSFKEVIGKPYYEVFPKRDGPLPHCLKSKEGAENAEEEIQLADGKIYSSRSFWVQDKDGQYLYSMHAMEDISERKQAEKKLQLAASVFTHAREGITITDAAGIIIGVNDSFTRITGYSSEDVLGRNPRILKSGQHGPEFYSALWHTLVTVGFWTGEVWNHRKSGELYAQMLTISVVRDADGKPQNYVALFSDITSMKEHEKQLNHIAHYDLLTNLPNRLLLADRLQQAMLQCQRRKDSLAVVFLDLDGFKFVNDTHGHDAGDEVLRVLSQRMKEALREGDTLARIGGDEFVVVLVDLAQAQDCEPLLTRLLLAASSPVTVTTKDGPVVLRVSASAGVTLYPKDDNDADLLMRHADQAMYIAKQSGKNRYQVFDLDQDAAIQTHHESLAHIRRALDRHEFVLFYQPKINMRSRRVTGAEALIRWQHPERGLLAPAAFLPMIEGHPISVEIGEWVINTALSQMDAWHAQGLDLNVSVNIGARQLQQEGFASRLAQLMAAHPDVLPQRLQLEVLETSALEDIVKVGAAMNACHALGVSFALDDFGTGYSSLTYLKHLPADTLKIDQSFVRGMLDDPDDLAIVNGVIGLAKAFGRQVIAEGVETSAHGNLLLSIGCDLAQGYGIARPVPANNFLDCLKSWNAGSVWKECETRPQAS